MSCQWLATIGMAPLWRRLLAGLVLGGLLLQLARCAADGAGGSSVSGASVAAQLQELQGQMLVLQQRLAALQGAAAVLPEPADAEAGAQTGV